MPIRLLGSLLTLIALLASYGMYVVLVVPWVDRSPLEIVAADPMIPREPPAARFEQLLQSHFPADSWERGEVNVLRTRQLLLIWKSHETVEEKRLRVYPLSIVMIDDASQPGSRDRRTWVLRAPAGAILQFDQDLNLAAGRFGRFHSGFIGGTVTALGTPSARDARAFPTAKSDDQSVEIVTRNLQFDDRRIWTSEEVSFHWGTNFGTGRDLMITMAPDSSDAASATGLPNSSVESLRLMRLDRLHVTTPSSSETFLDAVQAPLDVTAHGPLHVDLFTGTCRLTDRVQVERRTGTGEWERLRCDELMLHFSHAAGQRQGDVSTTSAPTGIPRFSLTRVTAKGQPLTLEATSDGRTKERQELEATSIHYQFTADPMKRSGAGGPGDRLAVAGGAEVMGPGRMVLHRDSEPPQHFETRFDRAIQWLPHGDGGLLSLDGTARCTAAGLGTFAADNMELQLKRDPQSSHGWQPVRMRGQGNVQVQTPRLQVFASDMNVTVIDTPTRGDASSNELQLDDPRGNTSPVIPLQDPTGPKLEMQGDRIELQLVGAASKMTLQAAALVGRVRCREISDVPGSPPRASMVGDEVRYVDLGRRQWRIDVTGKPAVVASETAELTGTNIHIDARQNRAWMDGPGLASLPMPAQFRNGENGEVPRAQLTWNRDMEFDGVQLVCRDGVSCRGPYQLLRGQLLRLQLARPIQIDQIQIRPSEIELATTTLEGSVFCENRTVELDGLQSIDTAQLQQLRYDHRTGRLDGSGPGWVETVRRGNRAWPEGTSTTQEFRFLRVDFERSLQGDMNQREVRFGDYVRTVYGPVPGWSDRIIAAHRDELPPDGLLLQCRELIVLQASGGTLAGRPLEFLALGDTTIDGREFNATAERLSYDQAKDLLILEGNDRTQAQIWYQARTGDKQSKEVAKKILYRPKTKELKIEGLQFLEFRTTGR